MPSVSAIAGQCWFTWLQAYQTLFCTSATYEKADAMANIYGWPEGVAVNQGSGSARRKPLHPHRSSMHAVKKLLASLGPKVQLPG